MHLLLHGPVIGIRLIHGIEPLTLYPISTGFIARIEPHTLSPMVQEMGWEREGQVDSSSIILMEALGSPWDITAYADTHCECS